MEKPRCLACSKDKYNGCCPSCEPYLSTILDPDVDNEISNGLSAEVMKDLIKDAEEEYKISVKIYKIIKSKVAYKDVLRAYAKLRIYNSVTEF